MNHFRELKGVITICSILLSFAGQLRGENELSEEGTDMSLEDLVNVKITVASKSEESISDAPGVISVITQDELKRFGGTTLGDILKRVPSLLGTTVYMTDRSVIASRGDQIMPSSSHILLLLNGRPMREVHEGGIKSEVYESFPVSVIERIEVIRGPGSVLYGSQAFSAVINVVTKKPENNTVAVSGVLGEGLRNNIMADLQYKFGDFGVVVAGRYADRGGWKMDWEALSIPPWAPDNITLEKTAISIPDYGPGVYGEVSYLDKKFLNFRYMTSYCQWINQYYVPDYQYIRYAGGGMSDVTGKATWKKYFNDFGYALEALEKYKLNVNLTYTHSWFETPVTFPMTSRNSYEIIGELTNVFTPVDNFNILLGGVWGFMTGKEGDAKADFDSLVYNKGHLQNNLSGYLQADYRWEWLKAIVGIQANKVRVKDSLDKVDDFKADYNPRGGLIFYPLEYVNIKALYSTAYRAPSIDELYLDYDFMSGQMIRNPRFDPNGVSPPIHDLEPEKVHTFDVGVNYQDEKVQVGINGFHSKMKNLIFQDRDPAHYAIPTWDNLGEVTIFGLECEGKYYITQSILFEGSFLYQQSRDENTGEDNVTPLPNFSAKGGLSYQSKFGLTVSAFNTFQQALDQKYGSTLNTTTEHFNMTNVHCSYDLNKLFQFSAAKELSLVLNVDNLLDEEVWLPAWGLLPGSTIPYNQGRTVYGGFKVAF
ncbi:MAG: TonB-dependent receptor [Chitinispirillaceae bacterium]|nr:TonB-dependent receptor [Chitinispirillaceae bacterium]